MLNPWFVGKDVCEVLGYTDKTQAIRKHCKGSVNHRVLTPGGPQNMKIIPERDLYRLVINSKLPQAESFEEWEVATVLPAILYKKKDLSP